MLNSDLINTYLYNLSRLEYIFILYTKYFDIITIWCKKFLYSIINTIIINLYYIDSIKNSKALYISMMLYKQKCELSKINTID